MCKSLTLQFVVSAVSPIHDVDAVAAHRLDACQHYWVRKRSREADLKSCVNFKMVRSYIERKKSK